MQFTTANQLCQALQKKFFRAPVRRTGGNPRLLFRTAAGSQCGHTGQYAAFWGRTPGDKKGYLYHNRRRRGGHDRINSFEAYRFKRGDLPRCARTDHQSIIARRKRHTKWIPCIKTAIHGPGHPLLTLCVNSPCAPGFYGFLRHAAENRSNARCARIWRGAGYWLNKRRSPCRRPCICRAHRRPGSR